MTQQLMFDQIQKRHQELLGYISENDDEFDVSLVKDFLSTLAQAGAYTENTEQRSLLRSLIRYWSKIIYDKTGSFLIVQLQPFNLSLSPERSDLNFFRRHLVLVAALSLITIIITIVVFVSIRLFTLHPSAYYCPSSQQVSTWMKVSVSQISNESCAFTAGNNGNELSGVVCTSQDGGTTIVFLPVNQRNTMVVRACDGSQLPNIWGFTIRFISGYPSGSASVCNIAQNMRRTLSSGWTLQADC